jgi:hypothetical protein
MPNDPILDRITWDPKASVALSAAHHPSKLKPIPWTTMLAPHSSSQKIPASLLPKVDATIWTWTVAEWQALTDVLDPTGHDIDYATNFASYRADLTHKSPAASSHCLARLRYAEGNGKSVLLIHSMLHLAVDGPNLPLRRLIDQIVDETRCERLITTGTAGGIGADKNLGDVIVGDACHFDCQKMLKDAPFAQASYPTTLENNAYVFAQAKPLVAVNMDQLAGQRTNPIWGYFPDEILTTDFFAFSTSDDHFGLRAYDSGAGAVEMDDSVFGLVIADRLAAGKPCPHWTAVRCVSDPEMDMSKYATEEDAATAAGLIYHRTGYWDALASVITSWLLAVA